MTLGEGSRMVGVLESMNQLVTRSPKYFNIPPKKSRRVSHKSSARIG